MQNKFSNIILKNKMEEKGEKTDEKQEIGESSNGK
jgi:hypothetical protein